MRKTTRSVLFFLLLVFGLVAAAPATTKGIFLFTGVFDCCKGDPPNAYCAVNGCWFTSNCVLDSDCNVN